MAKHISRSYETEQEARMAANKRPDNDVIIIHSPHPSNKEGAYFVEHDTGCLIRSWETVIFEGIGKDA